ncbi:hypothetical protein JTE90_005806 [Oedothorax gibbosus]|uniref:Uncharacterized protein n=1 Tax=Oedothorax gibbosus TaxID=931172 RepID=A0AAV6U9D5_9ARAC|nr:hypothetical protein JTE90_005806 [Oedothorax gibbosus]
MEVSAPCSSGKVTPYIDPGKGVTGYAPFRSWTGVQEATWPTCYRRKGISIDFEYKRICWRCPAIRKHQNDIKIKPVIPSSRDSQLPGKMRRNQEKKWDTGSLLSARSMYSPDLSSGIWERID